MRREKNLETFTVDPFFLSYLYNDKASRVAPVVKNPPAKAGDVRDSGLIPGQKDALEEGMATHSSILAWRIPWTEEPGVL